MKQMKHRDTHGQIDFFLESSCILKGRPLIYIEADTQLFKEIPGEGA